jgi:hypothetical protein
MGKVNHRNRAERQILFNPICMFSASLLPAAVRNIFVAVAAIVAATATYKRNIKPSLSTEKCN